MRRQKKSCTFCRTSNREKGITLVMVTHEHDIAAYATRILHMKDGQYVKRRDEIVSRSTWSNSCPYVARDGAGPHAAMESCSEFIWPLE